MTPDYLDKWLRERQPPPTPRSSGAGSIPWGAQDTDPSWDWDSGTAAATALANGATGEHPEPWKTTEQRPPPWWRATDAHQPPKGRKEDENGRIR